MALRRAYDASLEDRAAGAEAERDAQARLAAAAERGRELQERRARAVDESAARLRRIERDLHDGAQVRLTALAMALGEIKESLDAASVAVDGAGCGAQHGAGGGAQHSAGGGAQHGARGGAQDSARGGADGGIDESTRTRMLVAAAHRNAKEILAELRDLVRGIHPPVLDRGLGAALGALAATSPVPVGLAVAST